MTGPPPLLSLERIDKRFGPVAALAGASIALRAGTVHAVLGENGAGKTTLMRVAFGLLRPDAGVVRVDGVSRAFSSPLDAIAAGIGMVHQHFTIVPTMTVAENIALGGRGRYDVRAAARRVRDVADRTGLVLDPAARAGDLGVAARQRLEIVKALARDARLLILDEPTAVLAPAEAEDLLRRMRDFASGGRAVVLITHKLRETLSVADEVSVIRRGTTVLHAAVQAVDEARLIEAMLGSGLPIDESGNGSRSGEASGGAVVAAASDVTVIDADGVSRLTGASFEIRSGEIVGVAGVEGSGHRELLRLLAGRLPPTSGELRVPFDAGFIPEDRQHEALILDMPLHENVALRGAGRRGGRVRWRAIIKHTASLLTHFDVRARSPSTPARTLSGGNQQKLVFARELDGNPTLLVAENPTRGLDIRASAAVHEHLRTARAAGVAVVLFSSDLDEVLALADRMLVVHAGRIANAPLDRDTVGRRMLGAT